MGCGFGDGEIIAFPPPLRKVHASLNDSSCLKRRPFYSENGRTDPRQCNAV